MMKMAILLPKLDNAENVELVVYLAKMRPLALHVKMAFKSTLMVNASKICPNSRLNKTALSVVLIA